jgi:hypothetical protein
MAAAIMHDTTQTTAGQKNHLVFPGVRAQRPAVAEDNRLPLAQSLKKISVPSFVIHVGIGVLR